jgi:hypothetical protein
VTVPKDGLRVFVGTVPLTIMTEIREAILFALGFDDLE